MKKPILLLSVFFLASHLFAQENVKYQKTITDYLEVRNNVRTNLRIKYISLKVSDISVQDSIDLIKKIFDAEKAKAIADYEKRIATKEKEIAEIDAKSDQSITDKIMHNQHLRNIKMYKDGIEEWQKSDPDSLHKYDGRDPAEILAKKAICTFSYFNPKLQSRQTYQNSLFCLTKNGNKCLWADFRGEQN